MTGRPILEELLAPPDDTAVADALRDFAAAVRRHYGDRLKGLYLFGSRARGDHTPESDADVAVILADGDWVDWQERRVLNRLAYDPSLDSGLMIQPWPLSDRQWDTTQTGTKAHFATVARREAVPLRFPDE